MYNYKNEKPYIFTDQGQREFLKVCDHVKAIMDKAGAITMENAISPLTGCSWQMQACVDRLVELKEIKEIPQSGCAGQHRIFMPA